MSEPTAFEIRLRAALRRHVAAGPTDFDALGFARMVASAEPRRHGLPSRLSRRGRLIGGRPWQRSSVLALAWLLVALLLTIALIGGVLLAGAQRGPVGWQRIDLPGRTGSVRGVEVFASDDGCLAVGASLPISQTPWFTDVRWTSPDCLDWELAATGDTFAGGAAEAIVAGDDGFVAVGAVGPGEATATSHPMAWTSTDGRTWRRAGTVPAPEPGSMRAVAFADGRYVAVGGDERGAEIWWSQDGDHWVKAGRFAAGGKPAYVAFMAAVVAGGPGFVAAGSTDYGSIWASADGDTWLSIGPDANPGAGSIAVGAGGRVVALSGSSVLTGPASSASGGSWTSIALPGPDTGRATSPVGATIRASSVVTTDWGYVAVGSLERPGDWAVDPLGRGLVWTSTDGLRWSVADSGSTFAGVALERVQRRGDVLIVLGTDGASDQVWVAPEGAMSRTAIP